MSDAEEEREPTAEEMLDDALALVEQSIEHLLSLMGEEDDSILTDWAVVCVSQGFTEDGRPMSSDAMILPKRYLPGYRIKGLLIDAIDQYRASEANIIMLSGSDFDDEDDE